MSEPRARLRLAVEGAAVASTLFAFAVTHFPAPSGVGASDDDASRRVVRGAWEALGRLARAGADLGLGVPDVLASDKTIHFVIYLAPGALWALSLRLRRRHGARTSTALLLALAAWAGMDEWTQDLLSREGQWGDWLANVAGAATGILCVRAGDAVRERLRARPWTSPSRP